MKTPGIIGGLSPESTISYYKGINAGVHARLGGHHNAKILLSSLDFGEFVALKEKGDWDTQGELLAREAKVLERAGADFIVLATNTMHKMAAQITDAISIPFLHIGDATAEEIVTSGIKTIGLLGTRYTMEQDFYKGRLAAHGLEPLIPDEEDRKQVNAIIYDELCHGLIKEDSKQAYRTIIKDLAAKGAQGIILGCTEIGMLVEQSDSPVPLFDTTQIHINRTVEEIFSMEEKAA